jgi:hypothetical protein
VIAASLLGSIIGVGVPALPRAAICEGCLVAGREREEAQPLVVVLHGDEGSPAKVAGLWSPLAERGICANGAGAGRLCAEGAAGVVGQTFWLLAPKCPSSEGCRGSFWRWGGSVAWVEAQVDAFAREHRVDERRVTLAGWSGGATYISMNAPHWFPRFAAVSLAGGGMRPGTNECAPHAGGACAPVTYLMGSGNPLFALAEQARQGFERCGHAVDFQLLPGVDHAGEWRAYSRRLPEIAHWLLAHPQGCPTASDTPPPVASDAPDQAPRPTVAAPRPSEESTRRAPEPPKVAPAGRGGCSCEVPEVRSRSSSSAGLGLLASTLLVLRRRGRDRLGDTR